MAFLLSTPMKNLLRKSSPKLTEALVHAALWVALICLPLLAQPDNEHVSMRFLMSNWTMTIGLSITFYVNYLWAVDRLFYRKRVVEFVLVNLVLFLLLSFAGDAVKEAFNTGVNACQERPHPMGRMLKGPFIVNDFVFALLGIGAALGARYYKHLQASERERERLEAEKLQSEIALLRYQMQPHFFFNTLNNIYALIGKSPQEAQEAVHSLSKLMRYVLYEDRAATVSLESEIDFLRNYISLMRLRIAGGGSVDAKFAENTSGVMVPPLLFVPLLENAFKHGEGQIGVKLEVEAKCVIFSVENGIRKDADEDRSHSGIGLSNLRKRLEILYADTERDFHFEIGPQGATGRFRARLVIPII